MPSQIIQFLTLVVILTVVHQVTTSTSELKIAAFNIQIFGKAKAEDKAAMSTIVKIIQRYDLILIQEIRDASGEAILELLDQVNEGEQVYGMSISERLGRSTSKEQYAYLFREDELMVLEEYQYPAAKDQFERPPYCVKIRSKNADISEFSLIGVHTSPSKAFEEINALKDVHDELKKQWETEDIMIMGDLNADCSYVSKKKLTELVLRTAEYHWLIDDDADTTLAKSDCAYDRFILSGNRFLEALVPNSARIFHFDSEYSLSEEKAKDVSDHYPIEFSIHRSITSGGPSMKDASVLIQAVKWLLQNLCDYKVKTGCGISNWLPINPIAGICYAIETLCYGADIILDVHEAINKGRIPSLNKLCALQKRLCRHISDIQYCKQIDELCKRAKTISDALKILKNIYNVISAIYDIFCAMNKTMCGGYKGHDKTSPHSSSYFMNIHSILASRAALAGIVAWPVAQTGAAAAAAIGAAFAIGAVQVAPIGARAPCIMKTVTGTAQTCSVQDHVIYCG